MATHPKHRIDASGTVYRPVYAQLPIPVFNLLREMKYAHQKTYSELIANAITATYAKESKTYSENNPTTAPDPT